MSDWYSNDWKKTEEAEEKKDAGGQGGGWSDWSNWKKNDWNDSEDKNSKKDDDDSGGDRGDGDRWGENADPKDNSNGWSSGGGKSKSYADENKKGNVMRNCGKEMQYWERDISLDNEAVVDVTQLQEKDGTYFDSTVACSDEVHVLVLLVFINFLE